MGLLLIGVGAISYVGASLYEIGTSPRSVRAYNERTTRTALTVVPVVSDTSAGFTLVGAF